MKALPGWAIIGAFCLTIAGVIADCSNGQPGIPTPGTITGKIYTPPRTTIDPVFDEDGKLSHYETNHEPEKFTLGVTTPELGFQTTVDQSTFHRVHVGQGVTCQTRYGKWTGWSYGWNITSLLPPPNYLPERP